MRNIAHRGASARAPENTIPAFGLAAELGADLVELDVQRSADGELIVVHDDTFARTTDIATVFPGRADDPVGGFTLAELSRLDAGGGARIPTLAEVLELLESRGLGLLLEAKSPHRYSGIAGQIAATFRARPRWMRDGLIVESFEWEFLEEFRGIAPRITLGYLGRPAVSELSRISRISDQVNPNFADLDQSYVDHVHANGMDVIPWTVDDPADIARISALGVDGIITNTPDRI